MPSWNWGESQSESGVVHQSTANTDHNDTATLKQGYDYATFSEITPDPVACWPLHEDSGTTAYDLAGTNNGTINGATIGQTGLLGTSTYDFDGTDDYVRFGDGFAEGIAEITVSAWINADTQDDFRFFNKYYDGSDRSWAMEMNTSSVGGFRFIVATDSENANNGPSAVGTPNTGQWDLLTGTWSSSSNTVRLYQNATEIGSAASNGSTVRTNNSPVEVGAEDTRGEEYFDGRIADARIYDTALTQAQIQTLYDVVDTQGTWTGTAKPL